MNLLLATARFVTAIVTVAVATLTVAVGSLTYFPLVSLLLGTRLCLLPSARRRGVSVMSERAAGNRSRTVGTTFGKKCANIGA